MDDTDLKRRQLLLGVAVFAGMGLLGACGVGGVVGWLAWERMAPAGGTGERRSVTPDGVGSVFGGRDIADDEILRHPFWKPKAITKKKLDEFRERVLHKGAPSYMGIDDNGFIWEQSGMTGRYPAEHSDRYLFLDPRHFKTKNELFGFMLDQMDKEIAKEKYKEKFGK